MVDDKKELGGFEVPGREPAFYEVPWIRNLIRVCVVLAVVAGLYEVGTRIQRYGTQVVKKEFGEKAGGGAKMTLLAELKNRPTWLDHTIMEQIFGEVQAFAARDQVTYDRLLDPLDKAVLQEVAENFTGIDGKGVNHWALGENGWIKRVTEVRRVINKEKNTETIEIYAEYRAAAAWVVSGGKYYLIDKDFVRLPGEYAAADRKVTTGLMAIAGLENSTVPEPSVAWSGEDLVAGMKLVELLRREKYAGQIDAIDMSNFQGRKDAGGPWIVLDTVWPATNGSPSVVMWGRTPGEEKFYDISAAAKLKTLNELYLHFNRIDAGRDYVDIHGDHPQLPKLAVQGPGDGAGRVQG